MIELWSVSCDKFTAGVECEKGIIVRCAPIVQKFKGQNIENLIKWVNKTFKEVEICKMKLE